MSNQKEMSLVQISAGQKGIISQISGGYRMQRRLENLGIRPGQEITKVSTMLLSGPVVVRIQGSEVALGRGMAQKIFLTITD